MKLPDAVKLIRDRYVAKFGTPHGTPDTIDEIARQWSIGFAEQVIFDTKDPRWGVKRADSGRPIGKDTIAFNPPPGLVCWDLFIGTGTGNPQIVLDPDSQDIHDQVFVEVPAIDHIGGTNPPTPPAPPGHTLVDYFTWRDVIRKLYREELSRDVISDPDALVNWLFHWREEGQSESWIRDRIRESSEWKQKHGA